MKLVLVWKLPLLSILGILLAITTVDSGARAQGIEMGKPELGSLSALAFGPDQVLFIGDGKGGAVFAVKLDDAKARGTNDGVNVKDLEGKIAAFLGTEASEIMIHDMAVNPASQNVYLAVSRGRSEWDSRWLLPNDVTDAEILLRVSPEGKLAEVPLRKVSYTRAALPSPVEEKKTHRWKDGVSLRADTITDMAYSDGVLYVAGLSNEEFASTMWRIPYPFEKGTSATTLEIFHGAHGEWETHAPIRTFVPYDLGEKEHVLAAYLCTPMVSFPASDLEDGQHVKGRTVAEFGSGNYPLDMVVYRKGSQDRLLIANSNLPFMIIDPKDIASFEGSITEEVEGYLAGVPWEPRSGTGIQQMDLLNDDYILALQRLPGGTMDMVSLPVRRF